MPKKAFLPKDIHDLEDIYYDPKNAERKRKYESYIDAKVIDKIREAEAKRIMNNFGKSSKISTALVKKPDFKIEESKIVYEITSIQCSEEERVSQKIKSRSEQDLINDVNKAIEHALEKDYSEYRDYQKIVLVFIDTTLSALCKYTEYCAIPDLIRKTTFPNSNISCMIIAPLPSSIRKELAHTAYSKDDTFTKVLWEKLPKEFKVFRI